MKTIDRMKEGIVSRKFFEIDGMNFEYVVTNEADYLFCNKLPVNIDTLEQENNEMFLKIWNEIN